MLDLQFEIPGEKRERSRENSRKAVKFIEIRKRDSYKLASRREAELTQIERVAGFFKRNVARVSRPAKRI